MATDFSALKQMWPMPSQPVPITIIGAGGIVREAHLPAYIKCGFPVEGIYDIDQGRARDLAKTFSLPNVHADLEDAFAGDAPRIFDVAVPPRSLGDVLAHLPRGCTSLIQKPLGMNLKEAEALASILSERDITAAMNFQLRFTPAMMAVSGAIEAGMLGDIVDIDVRVQCHTPWDDWPFMHGLDHIELPLHSIHYLDWIKAHVGMPRSLYAHSVRHPDYPDRADAKSSIVLNYGPDIRCCLTLNHVHKWGERFETAEFRIEGTKGAAVVDMGYLRNQPAGRPEHLHMTVEGEAWQEDVPLQGARAPDSFAAVMANLQRFAAGEDETLMTNIPSSLATMSIVDGCMRSSDTGQAVRMDRRFDT